MNCFISLILYYLNKISLNHVFLFKLELLEISKCFIFSFKVNSLKFYTIIIHITFPMNVPRYILLFQSSPELQVLLYILFMSIYMGLYGILCSCGGCIQRAERHQIPWCCSCKVHELPDKFC